MNKTIYPIGIQNFEKIRKGGYLYIDKTALIYQLANTGSYYFLSRPPTLREKPVALYVRGLFPRKKGTVRGTGSREIRERMDKASHPSPRLEHRAICLHERSGGYLEP